MLEVTQQNEHSHDEVSTEEPVLALMTVDSQWVLSTQQTTLLQLRDTLTHPLHLKHTQSQMKKRCRVSDIYKK